MKLTRTAEREAASDFAKFKEKTEKTIGANEDDSKAKTKQKGEDQADLGKDATSLEAENGFLKGAINELMELRPTCVDTGMSFEDRSNMRKQEIESLLKASCMMNAWQGGNGEDVAKFGECGDITWGRGTADAA